MSLPREPPNSASSISASSWGSRTWNRSRPPRRAPPVARWRGGGPPRRWRTPSWRWRSRRISPRDTSRSLTPSWCATRPPRPGAGGAGRGCAATAREPRSARAWLADVSRRRWRPRPPPPRWLLLLFLRRLRLRAPRCPTPAPPAPRHASRGRLHRPGGAGPSGRPPARPARAPGGARAPHGALPGRFERAVASAALLALAALPWGAREAVRVSAWTGTLAEEVYALEHGAGD